MMKTIAIVASSAAILAMASVFSTPAHARIHPGPKSGYCPPGTCAQFDGGPWARNVKNCKASNCKQKK
jgi:hypothetical protein